jgi:predicted Zn-dependent protease
LNQGYSQDQELEADRVGVQLSRSAGFDSASALRLLCRLGASPAEATLLGTYLSSHPPLDLRLRHIERVLAG